MPAFARKLGRKWRVMHGRPPRILKNRAGTAVDGVGHPTRSAALAQARAINAREGGYGRRAPRPVKARKTRRNPPPGEYRLVWIWPDGGILAIPAGKRHYQAVPQELARLNPHRGRAWLILCSQKGFFLGMVINRRLYVEIPGSWRPTAAQLRQLRAYARRESLSRGIVIESLRDRL